MKRLLILFAAAMAFIFCATVSSDEAKEDKGAAHEYVGVKKCKMCHKKDGIHESWLATKHATAWDSLSAEDQKNKALAPFYTTGTTAKDVLLTGVQCEACHGAGSDYKKKTVMKDRDKAVAAGLIIPDSTSCMVCHNEKAPGVLGTTAKDFNFEKMKLTGIHADMKKPEGK
ncbi:MAG: cytochrome c family protein [candidate division Zixibacteria bacterium]|nr:cytochrome c family protein [candidate division Zixibacteria bacterium]